MPLAAWFEQAALVVLVIAVVLSRSPVAASIVAPAPRPSDNLTLTAHALVIAPGTCAGEPVGA
jgi:hypothetical protein